eukprot:TRINITY_DN1455_c0_g3_i2.p1 TRINITY_DN1455_c0_g3~~TRINITY_DN1455_c0_g3_i2.p1  ORF type:complete len:294 (+),score=106.87 TRINITY_DN1455_c0_g3_i2:281-1162(+)
MVLEEVVSESGYLGRLNGEQQDALDAFKVKLEEFLKENPECVPVEEINRKSAELNGYQMELIYLKFLRARTFKLKDSFNLYSEYLLWKAHFQDDLGVDNISTAYIEKEMRLKKGFMFGSDRDGRPICYIKLANHKKSESPFNEAEAFVAWFFEMLKRSPKPPNIETVMTIADLKGIGMENLDMALSKVWSDLLASKYPEGLGICLLVDAPWIFSAFWKVLRGFLDVKTREKFVFISREQLKDYVDLDQLPTEYGGTGGDYVMENDPVWVLGKKLDKEIEERLAKKKEEKEKKL